MIKELIALDDNAKVWIYQADRDLLPEEVVSLRRSLHQFMDEWTSHNRELVTYGNIFHNRFLALFVDETLSQASGCSIDSSVSFVRSMGNHFNIDFFDRLTYAYFTDAEQKKLNFIHHSDMEKAYSTDKIHCDTLFIDNLVKTKKNFIDGWVKPLKDSWHYRFVS